ncbi:hypothetical protein NQ176_g4293 [Zarea fungicola]|uniref:Uncharacterized protein n=1 Tax=Zarea fungicola TaxID=93591 RepID=A0ACC1NE71_9HYPO|nr:hypothetical protein NQ176_g4293 [Lecanicillium fungicola]
MQLVSFLHVVCPALTQSLHALFLPPFSVYSLLNRTPVKGLPGLRHPSEEPLDSCSLSNQAHSIQPPTTRKLRAACWRLGEFSPPNAIAGVASSSIMSQGQPPPGGFSAFQNINLNFLPDASGSQQPAMMHQAATDVADNTGFGDDDALRFADAQMFNEFTSDLAMGFGSAEGSVADAFNPDFARAGCLGWRRDRGSCCGGCVLGVAIGIRGRVGAGVLARTMT